MMQSPLPVAAAVAANHCEMLRARRSSPAELVPDLGRAGERLASSLGEQLAEFFGEEEPTIRCSGAETTTSATYARLTAPLAAHSLLGLGATKHRVLISIDARIVLAELDRTFGGTGDIDDDDLPAALPKSAELLARKIEQKLVDAFTAAVGGDCALRNVGGNSRYSLLSPFPEGEDLAVLTLEVDRGDRTPWTIRFETDVEGLPVLLSQGGKGARGVARQPASPLDKPFADVPLPVEAQLVDMNIPLSRLAALAPGMVIPVAVARSVPLRIGDAVIARGTVGEMDDRIALQITQTLVSGKEQQ
ncbi:flagellar motor switch protein FliM [Altererythrobacter sp. B11]|uniref:FliM/FliN family flagellar motor C-terminal domain-containing protein n=1 Tax=Altererythrobacter sp. B11 TaxID=2060312 RepID=UPI000DC71604|nr:FliM/FliN family flagellar motor C-terminal domain-containing protein [Altererythrobacter sp. B11]BBC72148.1 flagellar motor switch protein FliM [Altererythrobacter sp. B11]